MKYSILQKLIKEELSKHTSIKEGDETPEKVWFLKKGGEVYAAFPNIKEGANTILSYSHIGQHSEADLGYVKSSKKATKEEYMPLYDELTKQVGYNLIVLNKDFSNGETPIAEVNALWRAEEGSKISKILSIRDTKAILTALSDVMEKLYTMDDSMIDADDFDITEDINKKLDRLYHKYLKKVETYENSNLNARTKEDESLEKDGIFEDGSEEDFELNEVRSKIYNSFTDKFNKDYKFDNYADFAKFWFSLSRKTAMDRFPTNFKKLQNAATNSKEAKAPLLKGSHNIDESEEDFEDMQRHADDPKDDEPVLDMFDILDQVGMDRDTKEAMGELQMFIDYLIDRFGKIPMNVGTLASGMLSGGADKTSAEGGISLLPIKKWVERVSTEYDVDPKELLVFAFERLL